jgi:hypothetical protein
MRYWYRTDNGNLIREAEYVPTRGHSEFAQTPDLADIPGPILCCKWNGAAVVVDAARLAAFKERLRERIETKAILEVQEGVLTTPWGDFRVRKDDIDAYQMVAFSAIYALQTSSAFSMTLRRADDTSVSVTASQFMQFINLVGQRMAAKLAARDTQLDQLAAATPEQLKGVTP